MKPAIGRPVQYTGAGGIKFPPEVYAALIVKVHPEGTCDLMVFSSGNLQFDKLNVPFTSCPAGSLAAVGCWSWVPEE